MSERFAQELPQSINLGHPYDPSMWAVPEEAYPAMRAMLRYGGVDLEAPSIDRALAGVHHRARELQAQNVAGVLIEIFNS